MGAALWFILASFLNVHGYGEISYLLSVGFFFVPIALLGMVSTMLTYLPKGEIDIVPQAKLVVLIASLFIAIGLSTFNILLSALLASNVFFQLTITELLAKRNYRKYMYVMISSSFIRVCLSILFYYIIGINGIILGYAIQCFIFSYSYFFSLRNITFQINFIRSHIRFIIRNCFASLAQNTSLYLDKIIVGQLFGFIVLANYQFGYQIYLALTLIPLSIYQYLLPQEARGVNKRNIKIVGISTSAIAAIIAYLLSPWIVTNMFPQFKDSIEFTRIIVISIIPLTLNQIFIAMLLGKADNAPVLTGSIIYVGSLIVFLIAFGQLFGLVGFAMAVLLSNSIQAFFLLANLRTFKIWSNKNV